MPEKKKITLMTIDGEKTLNEEVLETIFEKMYNKFDFSHDIEPSYHSCDPFEQSFGASVEITGVSASVSIEELKEIYKWDTPFMEKLKKFFKQYTHMDYLEDAVCNYDCYPAWETFVEDIEDMIESEIPAFKITSSTASISFNKDRTAIVLDFEVSDYEFDEREHMEAYAPDPYDEYIDRLLDERDGF